MSKLVKISGKVFSENDDGDLVERTYEQILYEWLSARSPEGFDTEAIARALDMPYDTIQPKLKWMATDDDCPPELKVIMSKRERAIGQIGRRRYLWSV